MSDLNIFHGPNAGYALELYERYQQDPTSVDPATRAFFDTWTPTDGYSTPTVAQVPALETGLDTHTIVGAARLIRYIRELGHLAAHLDPLGDEPLGDPGLQEMIHGVTQADLMALPADIVRGPLVQGSRNAYEAIEKLRQVYAGSIGYETDHVQIFEERAWMREMIESGSFFQNFDAARKRDLLQRLTEVETFEQFLHRTFLGQKRFSIEGNDMLVPMLDSIIRNAAAAGTREVVLGMAHRGRLNVLAHVLGKPYAAILQEFQAASRDEGAATSGKGSMGWTGDVKYHLGARRAHQESGIEQMPITLAPNPSHLEFVNPVVVGSARAAQERWDQPGAPKQDEKISLAILIHGDAAFPGQGIVAETLNLSRLRGYHIGGTIHIIVNNQIGFTTVPGDTRSTLYASDLAKGFEIPIVHVNADDPEACIAAARMANAYVERFRKDFLIDLIGYRRWGHNEGDEPMFTQPRMYQRITTHPTVRELWAHSLAEQGIVGADEADAMVTAVQQRLQQARQGSQSNGKPAEEEATQVFGPEPGRIATAVPLERLIEFNDALLQRPETFIPNPKLERTLQRRRTALQEDGTIEWAHAEALALAAILADGTPIRFTGQDVERGTFSQRHLVLHDLETGERHIPLQELPQARASFAIYNSPLSENAALGFEYGYSVHAPGVLVLWEAQFGDFANSGQVIIDQFLVAGRAKWRQQPSLVLLLPHGYEGQGPEHSSARLERYLQLAAGDNIRVANCSTAAQYFHLLRRHAALLHSDPRPLMIMTPKSLLRHPRAAGSPRDLASGSFYPVLDDPDARDRAEEVTRLVLCSGKVYVDAITSPNYEQAHNVAIIRIEELHPFPAGDLETVIERYPHAREAIWLQEEPRNMGAWNYVATHVRAILPRGVELRYVGRPEFSSPSEGSLRQHVVEQARIVQSALTGAPELQTKTSGVHHAR